ncbi:MAG: type IV pilus secretin PilQ [Pseudobdellovibrio sp.]
MKKLKLNIMVLGLIILTQSCTSDKKISQDDEFSTDSVAESSETAPSAGSADDELSLGETPSESISDNKSAEAPVSSEEDGFAEFDSEKALDKVPGEVADSKATSEDDLEKELNNLEDMPTTVANNQPQTSAVNAEPELTLDDVPPSVPTSNDITNQAQADKMGQAEVSANSAKPVATDQPAIEIPQITIQPPPMVMSNEQVPSPMEVAIQPIAPPAPLAPVIGQISSVQYQSNQSGGTVVINSDQPLQFTTRSNPATHQLVVEIQNSIVPKKLKRSLNTKDMSSSIGSVDIYQKTNSSVARFVIQLRPGSPEPLVQPEGTALLIVGAANPSFVKRNETDPIAKGGTETSSSSDQAAQNPDAQQVASSSGAQQTLPVQSQEINPDLTSEGIMNSQSLEDFLASNNKFYGKKISIEAVNLDIFDAFKFLSEESGVNMIIDEGVKGNVTLKLRRVPWDQAFVLILKSKKLGYRRQGNVIRVADIANLQREEDDAIKLSESRKNSEPLAVKRFFIGYADIADLEKKIKDFISTSVLTATGTIATTPSRGKVISDTRTSSLIVTETLENLAKIEKLVAALDTQPKQVLIEGKIVEAKESFVRGLGVNWSSPDAGAVDSAPSGNFIRPSLKFATDLGGSVFTPSFGLGKAGRPGDLGNLTASLALGEREEKLRVLSSPRISVLSSQTASIAQTVNVLIDKVTTTATTGVTTVTKDVVPVGVSLNVTPQVSNEGTVVMDLTIERSFAGGGGAIEKRNAKTKVIVRSGQTAVIGGIFQADSSDLTSGIPFFKDIPIFGLLFKGNQIQKSKNELVIFVTPKIQKLVQGDAAQVTNFE